MQKWEYLLIHVTSAKSKVEVSVNGEDLLDVKSERELIRYLNSLGAEGWGMINADRNEYGFQNYFFKRPIE